MTEAKYFVDNLAVVFPEWKDRCEEMKPYAIQIWKHGHLPPVGEEFPEIEWEGDLAMRDDCGPIVQLKGVEDNDGALVKPKGKRRRQMTIGSSFGGPKKGKATHVIVDDEEEEA